MLFSRRVRYCLFSFLIFVNLAYRYPFTPHEIGWDSFFIHHLANIISADGHVNWWIHPLSTVGLYPYSYPGGVPLLLSAFSQISGLDMDITAWIFSTFIGVLSGFFAYLMAGEISNHDMFKFVMAIVFSTMAGLLDFTTWTVSTRGLFIVFLPLFIYSILKFRNEIGSIIISKYFLISIMLFLALVSTHHLYTFLIPILIAHFISGRMYFIKRSSITQSRYLFPAIFLVIAIIMITLILREIEPGVERLLRVNIERNIGDAIGNVIIMYSRHIGLLGVLGLIGFFFLIFKRYKSKNDFFLIFSILMLIPFSLIEIYMATFVLIFVTWLIAFTTVHIWKWPGKHKKQLITIVISMFFISLSISGVFQVRRSGIFTSQDDATERYLEEENLDAALWVSESTMDGTTFSTSWTNYFHYRIAALSEHPNFNTYEVMQISYGFIEIDPEFVSPMEIYFWSESHFRDKNRGSVRYQAETIPYYTLGSDRVLTSKYQYNIYFYVEDKATAQTFFEENPKMSVLSLSVQEERYKLYENCQCTIWMF